MLRFVFSVLLALSVLPSIAVAQQTFDVYIVAGQSNTDGRGDVSDLTTAQLASLENDTIISFLNPGSERERANPTSNPNDLDVGTNGFAPLVPGGFSVDGTSARMLTPTFGPELAFGAFIAEATGTDNQIAIIKVSRGGTNLRNDWRVNPTVDSGPDEPEGFLYRALLEEVTTRLAELEADGSTAIVRGVVWHQGESDSNNGVNQYVERYIEFVNSFRMEFGADIPFVLGELSRDRISVDGDELSLTFNNNINQLAADSADPNNLDVPSGIFVVSSLDLETPRSLNPTNFSLDGTHFTANGQLELGQRFVAAFATADFEPLPEPQPEPPSELVLFDFVDGGVVDGAGNPATSTANFDNNTGAGDVVTLAGLSLTVVDVLAPEYVAGPAGGPPFVESGNILRSSDGDNVVTNISGNQQALGIANPSISNSNFDMIGGGTESSDINPGESLIFTFDQDVIFTSIELESVVATDTFDVLVDGVALLETTGDDAFIDDLGLLGTTTIAAGSEITFAIGGNVSNGSLRMESFEVRVVAETAILGDFNGDGTVDVDDIDFYIGNIGAEDTEGTEELAQLDLNGDENITIEDLNFHITTLAETSNGVQGALLGDLNLDGRVDVLGDAFELIANIGSNGEISYGLGNINGDLMVDILNDAFLLIGNLGLNNDSSVSAP